MSDKIISGPVLLRSSIGNHIDVNPDFLGTIIKGKMVFVGDVHKEVHEVDGSMEEFLYPVVFYNGCFHIDESRLRDGADPGQLTPIHLMTNKLNIVARTRDPEYKHFLKSIK